MNTPKTEGWGKPAASTQAPAATPAADPLPAIDEFCYVLHTSDGEHERLAGSWRRDLLARTPGSAPKLVTEIKLARLSERHSVIVLFRREGETALQQSKQVFARDHWRSEGEDGAVDVRALIGALAPTCLPAVLKLRRDTDGDEDLGVLRVGYA